jgi:hypothetical protein
MNIKDSQCLECDKKCNYGCYCYKHRESYLIDSNDNIIISRFTNKSKDYNKKYLIKYYKDNFNLKYVKKSKDELFESVSDNIIKDIIKLQSLLRGEYIRNKSKCNNDEDFNTFESLYNIPDKYYISYKDNNNIRWGFDIRSLNKLIEFNILNPYTTESLPEKFIEDVKNKYNKLKKSKSYENLDETIKMNNKDNIKQKCVDLFSIIEQSGYTCDINWFLSLNLRRLKELYKQLEDIWNWRAQLSEESKRRICPPDANIFKTPIIEIMNNQNKEDIQSLILHDVLKFKNAEESDKKLGIIYFLISLSYVSGECRNNHINWIQYVF